MPSIDVLLSGQPHNCAQISIYMIQVVQIFKGACAVNWNTAEPPTGSCQAGHCELIEAQVCGHSLWWHGTIFFTFTPSLCGRTAGSVTACLRACRNPDEACAIWQSAFWLHACQPSLNSGRQVPSFLLQINKYAICSAAANSSC